MGASQLTQRHGDSPVDEGGQQEGEDYRRACHFDGGCGAKQQAGADGATDGHHGHLPGAKLVV